MKLSISIDARMMLREVYILLLCVLIWFFFYRVFSLKVVLFIWIIIIPVGNYLINYCKAVFFEKPYLYLKKHGEKASPIKDTPIKLPDIAGFSLNNPFPSFDGWCKSSHNLTLYFTNGKHRTFSVKEQSMLVDWLKENNISCISKKSIGNIIEHIIYTAANVFFIMFYFYQIKAKDTDLDIILLLISTVCFVCWIVYIFIRIIY